MKQLSLLDEPKRPARKRSIVERFEEFHAENPQVHALFERFTFEVIRAGFKRCGAREIWERMRWHKKFETNDAQFKLNDHYTTHYARLFMSRHPEHGGLFELRNRR